MTTTDSATGAARERITEYLEIDLDSERWHCRACGNALGSAREDYKRGLLLYDRDPRDLYPPLIDAEYSYSPDPTWCRIVEYYCPHCAVQMEAEYLPPGHPLTYDIEIDVDSLQERRAKKQGAR